MYSLLKILKTGTYNIFIKVYALIIVSNTILISSTTYEGAFSVNSRAKNWLRSTMNDEQRNEQWTKRICIQIKIKYVTDYSIREYDYL